MTDLKEIARSFGMSIESLAERIGYTRPGLYKAVTGNCNTLRMYAALNSLKEYSDHSYQADVGRAERAREKREQAIRELAKACKVLCPMER